MPKKDLLIQYAALPYVVEDGHPMVVMVTSRDTGRWILPKGKPEKKVAPHQVAAHEAFEEAGLVGNVSPEPFARFPSIKRLSSGRELPCEIEVYLFKVDRMLDKWPEMKQRERRCLPPGEAALLASESGLVGVLLEFSAAWNH